MNQEKVLLGMSGGVDSSVSALILKNKGYDVIGVTLELYSDKNSEQNENNDAKKICKFLKIPYFYYDYKKEFEKYVINNFIECYSNCKTPNPCIECNRYMKFGAMFKKAKELRM